MQWQQIPMLARHSLVWLSANGWQRVHHCVATDFRASICAWQQSGWPTIARRRDADSSRDEACVGIALPPHPVTGIKRRVALRVPLSDMEKVTDPIGLEEALQAAPAAWREQLTALHAEAVNEGINFKVYGSLALQAITNKDYLSTSSDIDLLFQPLTGAQLSNGLRLLFSYAAKLPLDGEIVFPSGQAVAWKEWIKAQEGQSGCRVLVKDIETVRLSSMEQLLSNLEQ